MVWRSSCHACEVLFSSYAYPFLHTLSKRVSNASKIQVEPSLPATPVSPELVHKHSLSTEEWASLSIQVLYHTGGSGHSIMYNCFSNVWAHIGTVLIGLHSISGSFSFWGKTSAKVPGLRRCLWRQGVLQIEVFWEARCLVRWGCWCCSQLTLWSINQHLVIATVEAWSINCFEE